MFYIYILTYKNKCVIYVCMHVCILIHTHTRVCVCVCTYIYMCCGLNCFVPYKTHVES